MIGQDRLNDEVKRNLGITARKSYFIFMPKKKRKKIELLQLQAEYLKVKMEKKSISSKIGKTDLKKAKKGEKGRKKAKKGEKRKNKKKLNLIVA